MSVGPARASCQVMIAPPAPSGTIRGIVWLPVAPQIVTPPAAHSGVPEALTRRARMSPLDQATIAPAALSATATGSLPLAVESRAPFATQPSLASAVSGEKLAAMV